ncbi:hypothetical protein [Actinoallomurus sp. NPDC050550]|uniref:hypothetical protein n=1 Tax=Actinoallomurus sp. NPDC050550 TaxID=3154937 RepID=UPI0033EA8C68
MFRERPEFAVEVLRDLIGLEVPDAVPVQVERNDFNDRPSKDFQPDAVITLGPRRNPVHGIIMEAQQEKTEGEVDALLTVLEGRHIELSESARARICASTDVEEIKAWIKRALVATSIDELFADGQER